MSIAFLYYIGLVFSLIVGLIFKVNINTNIKTGPASHLRLDLMMNALKKIVVNKKRHVILESPFLPNLGVVSLYTVFMDIYYHIFHCFQ